LFIKRKFDLILFGLSPMSPYMASLYSVAGKPFWYLRIKKGGVWVKRSTGLRVDDPGETSQARQLRAEAEASELRDARKKQTKDIGWEWVESWLTDGKSPRTAEKYSGCWHWLAMWLGITKLDVREIRYSHVDKYLLWRINRRKRNTGKAAGRNTAIQEVKLLDRKSVV